MTDTGEWKTKKQKLGAVLVVAVMVVMANMSLHTHYNSKKICPSHESAKLEKNNTEQRSHPKVKVVRKKSVPTCKAELDRKREVK